MAIKAQFLTKKMPVLLFTALLHDIHPHFFADIQDVFIYGM